MAFIIVSRSGCRVRIGCDGIGEVLFESIRGFYYAESAAILILMVITLSIVDLLSHHLRKLVI